MNPYLHRPFVLNTLVFGAICLTQNILAQSTVVITATPPLTTYEESNTAEVFLTARFSPSMEEIPDDWWVSWTIAGQTYAGTYKNQIASFTPGSAGLIQVSLTAYDSQQNSYPANKQYEVVDVTLTDPDTDIPDPEDDGVYRGYYSATGLPGGGDYSWAKTEAPGTVTFEPDVSANPTATFSDEGTYDIEVTYTYIEGQGITTSSPRVSGRNSSGLSSETNDAIISPIVFKAQQTAGGGGQKADKKKKVPGIIVGGGGNQQNQQWEYDKGQAIFGGYSPGLLVKASPGEVIKFRAELNDKDKKRQVGATAWIDFDGTGPYDTKFTMSGEADFQSTHEFNSLKTDQVDLKIRDNWNGNDITVTLTTKDEDTKDSKDGDYTENWTIKKLDQTKPTGMQRVSGPTNWAECFHSINGGTATKTIVEKSYRATPDLPPAGQPDYEGIAIQEFIGAKQALGFTLADTNIKMPMK